MNEFLNQVVEQDQNNVAEQDPWENIAQEVGEFKKARKEKAEISEINKEVFKSQFNKGDRKNMIIQTAERSQIYRIEGALTEENIAEINKRKDNATYILDNTAGLTSDVLSKIKADGVFFSIKGGLDYENVDKYNDSKYQERTMMSPKGLEKAVAYFEQVESGINPEWNNLQKAMYCYGCLADDMSYLYEDKEADPDGIMGDGQAVRGLNGILYGKLVCAGFAFTYQEMMNRQGVKCHYGNQKGKHAYNVLEIDDKFYGIDVTWDSTHKGPGNRCDFHNFGQDENFYQRNGHRNYSTDGVFRFYDKDEQQFQLSTLTDDEFRSAYSGISDTLNRRQFGAPYKEFESMSKEERELFLPVDRIEKQVTKESDQECADFVAMFKMLRQDKRLKIDQRLVDAVRVRVAFVDDMSGSGEYGHGMEEKYGVQNVKDYRGFVSQAKGMNIDFSYFSPGVTEENVVNNLNQQLTNQIMQKVVGAYRSADSILKAYDYGEKNSSIVEGDSYSKLMMIVGAKGLLIESGFPEDEVVAKCAAIQTKLEADDSIDADLVRKNGIDFLSGVFQNKAETRKHIETVEGRPISDEEFVQKSTDANYLLNSVYTNLNLDEYGLSIDDFSKILKGEL